MAVGQGDVMAQAVYLAQLEAQKGTCKCRACQLLRKACKSMTDQFLGMGKGGGSSSSLAELEAGGPEETEG